MLRINVTGNAGAGKTTLARQMGELLDVPVFGLDSVVWQPGWKRTPQELRAQRINELIQSPSWIIDGVSHQVRAAADVVIFLDIPCWKSAIRCGQRSVRYLLRSRPELPDGCPEILVMPRLLPILMSFHNTVRPKILDEMQSRQYLHLRSRRDYELLIDSVQRNGQLPQAIGSQSLQPRELAQP